MCSDDVAIRVTNVGKSYHIYDAPVNRLKQFVLPRLRRLMGMSYKQYFSEFWSLTDITFEIKKGETVGIIGRNGSGKSTLLQIICGTLTPTTGSVEVAGRVAALLELGSGFNPEFSGRENVYMNAAVLGLTKEQINGRYDEIVRFADIGDFINQPVKSYSSGMLVRLAFAVIAHVDADVLIIDEALSVGDAFFTQKCMRFLRKFMKHGTVLFVSHDMGAVTSFCNHGYWLDKGCLKFQGSPKEVSQKYLAELYESEQGQSLPLTRPISQIEPKKNSDSRDMRLDFINTTTYRNDIQLFKFIADADRFGKGGGDIVSVQFFDINNQPLDWIVGGEYVKLFIICQANQKLISPIIGFYVNNRLGQSIFGDNTYNFSKDAPLIVNEGEQFEGLFEFYMPLLPIGDYTVTVALAEGNQDEHIQHDWKHDAILFKSHSSSVSTGLMGLPMKNISLSII